ncbi:hypothetical protein M427DRAFT_33764 [Gonapodya prolifera JEL478]|uniref:CBM1 domain-containing protein n=1 Tax=Gonapodya prolifera (strain JEL478) TaxID=1344416 RepID=A0A139AA09_GONPJ|nr:hypothetical protein M427DRAFT_33764 [Gonapodya prolifera JEL478]|eukprot:KXS13567.1 hypothetical protein M427DRAFT_33764 [Gonapodya prolifera JEL478]
MRGSFLLQLVLLSLFAAAGRAQYPIAGGICVTNDECKAGNFSRVCAPIPGDTHDLYNHDNGDSNTTTTNHHHHHGNTDGSTNHDSFHNHDASTNYNRKPNPPPQTTTTITESTTETPTSTTTESAT